MPTTLWLGIIGSAVLYGIYVYVRSLRLKDYPGPAITQFSDLWQLWFMYADVKRDPYRHLHDQYGPVVRMAPNKLYFSEPQAAKDIFNLRRDLKKSPYYNVSAPVAEGRAVTNFFASTDANYHDTIRRAVQTPFNMSQVVTYEHAVDAMVAQLVTQWRERYADKKGSEGVTDLADWCRYFALDAISNVTYSAPYGFLERGEDIENMIHDIELNLTYQTYAGQAPWLDKLFAKNPIKLWLGRRGYFGYVSPPVFHAAKNQGARLAGVEEKIKATNGEYKRTQGTGHHDLLDRLIQIQGEQPDVINEIELLKVGLAVVFAGADSTAAMLAAIFYHLMKNPRTYAKLRKELDDKLGSFDFTGDAKTTQWPTFATLTKTPYLDAVIKESMRRFAVVRFTPERVTPPEGMEIAGHRVPGGIVVGTNPWAVQHSKSMYGDDVDEFRPERWLECSEEKYREMNANLMLFGQGKYSCIGQNISQLEMFKMVPAVVRAFDMTEADPAKVWTFKHGLFVNLEDIPVRLSWRLQK